MTSAARRGEGLDVSLFDYVLPPERIAQEGIEPRDAARLYVLPRDGGAACHRVVRDLPDLLRAGDLLVLNDTRVVPARLEGRKPTGGRVEIVLLEREGGPGSPWRAQVSASRVPREGSEIVLPFDWRARVLGGADENGVARLALQGPGTVEGLLERAGRMPLPPYIRRAAPDARDAVDSERYQTVFARVPGAVAAPTAGLHLGTNLLGALAAAGVETTHVTLHVGEGTFRPVRAATTDTVRLHEERYVVPRSACAAIERARACGGRVVAVGTTVVRALESRPDDGTGIPRAGEGATRLCITPGVPIRYVDALLTNFHLPRSSLLMLVAAFAGRERVLAAYEDAVARGYRFYSYGDAMLIA